MTLNQREKKIAWVVGSLLGLYVLYAFVLAPFYLDPIRDLDKKIAARRQQQQQEEELLANRGKVRAQWDKLVQSGLDTDYARATTNISNAILRMVQQWRLSLVYFKSDQPASNTKSDFAEIPFNLVVNCTSSNFSSFLYSLETAGLPIRVDNITIGTNKPGQDDLNVDVKIAILLYTPRPQSIRIAGTQPGSTTRPATPGIRSGLTIPSGAPAAATAPAARVPAPASTGAQKTDEEILAELKARRAREDGGAAPTVETPATTQPTNPAQPPGGVR